MSQVADDTLDPSAIRRRRLLLLIPLAVFVALAALFFVRLFAGDASRVPSALIDKPVPVTNLAPLAGLQGPAGPVPGITPDLLAGGRVTVVNIWASWCAPCRVEHPLLVEMARDKNLQVVGINYKDQTETARRFLGALGNPFAAVGVDPDGRMAIEWGVYGVPETFIVDGRGVIRHKHVGPLTPDNIGAFRERLAEIRRAR